MVAGPWYLLNSSDIITPVLRGSRARGIFMRGKAPRYIPEPPSNQRFVPACRARGFVYEDTKNSANATGCRDSVFSILERALFCNSLLYYIFLMDAVIARILLVLCTASGTAYFFFALRQTRRRNAPGRAAVKDLVFHSAFSLILILQGISFLFYYPFNSFGFLSNMLSVSFIYGGFVLARWFRTEKQRNMVIFAHAALFFFLTVWKLVWFDDIPFVARFPLNVCNVIIVLIVFRFFYRNDLLDNIIICSGIIAALACFFTGSWFDNTAAPPGSFGHGFFYYRMMESALLHNAFFSFCVYCIVTKFVVVDVKKTMLNMLWIIPYFFVFSFINQIWKTDYFFTGVYGVTPPFLIGLYYFWPLRFSVPIGGSVFDVNICHSLFIIVFASLGLFVFSLLISAVQRRIR
jgi:hypothetical protein